MQRYEYKRVIRYTEEDSTKWSWLGEGKGISEQDYLSRLGNEGWELVAVAATSERPSAAGRTEFLNFYLKKPL
jgi:hypothetical protein